ncbi:hypothetical protein [Massilia consociata]|uniref:Uncharacterized protein n=1 Tax=Massilia consociata TaxID=760117 RepID=A0ABV6FIP0_9BURK
MARLTTDGSAGSTEDAVRVWRLVFDRFIPLIGPLSTDLVFARTLSLHQNAFPWLPQVAVSPAAERAFALFVRSLDGRAPDELVAANRALLAAYTAEMAYLIGDTLANHFLRSVFLPDGAQKE